MAAQAGSKSLKVTLVRSPYGRLRNHRDCVRGLGLKRLNHSVVVADTPAVRGMLTKASYLLRVEEV